ncbi:hypothetical protein, unknown function [Leishmania donovani]|uniref:Uncharacterized protein n=1 Tax=Leishmania donovani TaxID=5661 RepID=E9BGA2_LEIDO|nr:hypothetical protein, unknown function [Leishmania donovani]TPP50276.1 hypothetical protein CGC21_17295 [Leishmania donovani]CBZ34278.1 hypothetical protein, unknown function [Leishmania donovani]
MSWAGFSAGGLGNSGRVASTGFSYRGRGTGRATSQFSAGYARGGGGLTGYGGYGGVSGIGRPGIGGGGLLRQVSSGVDGGSETPRVAIIGTGPTVFQQWWAIHAGGLRVSVVVGTDDAKATHSCNALRGTAVAAAASDAERKASAERACAVALRCVQFYRLPQANKSAAAGADKPLVDVRVCAPGSVADPVAGGGAEDESKKTSATSAVVASSILASASAASVPAQEKKNCVMATAWSWFFSLLPSGQSCETDRNGGSGIRAPFSSSAAVTGAGSWPARSGAASLSSTPMASDSSADSLVDDVEVIYLVDYGADFDEAGVRAALLWLLERDKQIVVECALSAETLAACAAAAAAVARGKPEMKRLFLYRGGGCRRGWSDAAVTQLRKSLGVRRATCKTGCKAPSVSSPAKTALGGRSAFTTVSTKTAAPAVDSNGGFSVFDFMDSHLGGALKDAEGPSGGGMENERSCTAEKSSVTVTPTGTAMATLTLPEATPKAETKHKPSAPAPTSIAVDAAASVVGAVRHICMVAIDHGSPFSIGPAAVASLGIMDSLGWDAVAVVLHLLDWTCPDMVVGRVLRRAPDTLEPLCVQAEMYYGIEGTAKEGGEEKGSAAGRAVPARPSYLCVSLHIATCGSSIRHPTDEDNGDRGVFQQSLRIIGTKAVLTVDHPLLPAASPSTAAPTPSAAMTTAAAPAAGSSSLLTGTATSVASPSDASSTATAVAASGNAAMPTAPKVSHSYRLATQDMSPASGQRERREEEVTVGSAEPCAEFRTWQHVRSQLNVTATSASPRSGAGLGTYQLYNSRYANRGVSVGLGARSGYYDRGRGTRGRRTDFGGGLDADRAAASGTSVAAEMVDAESAALDVQHAWLVQVVVESILASAAKPSL